MYINQSISQLGESLCPVNMKYARKKEPMIDRPTFAAAEHIKSLRNVSLETGHCGYVISFL